MFPEKNNVVYKGIIIVSLPVAMRKYSDKSNIRKKKFILFIVQGYCLSWFGFLKKHCDHSNSYKESLIEVACLQFRGSIHYHHGGERDCRQTDRPGAGAVAESSTFGSEGSRKRE